MAEFTVILYRDDARAAALSAEESERAWAAHIGFHRHCAEQGWEIVATRALGAAARGRSLRSDGRAGVVVTDGPFAETVEQLGGFYLVTAPNREAVLKHAMLLPEYTIEVREIAQM